MGLTGKILLFIATLVVLLVGGTLAFTTVQANQLARSTIDAGLKETRDVWHTVQDDRFKKLRLGGRVLANDPYFKAAIAERDQNTTLDSLGTTRDGGAYEWALHSLLAVDAAGRVAAFELFAEDDWDAALARLDDLGAASSDPRTPRAERKSCSSKAASLGAGGHLKGAPHTPTIARPRVNVGSTSRRRPAPATE